MILYLHFQSSSHKKLFQIIFSARQFLKTWVSHIVLTILFHSYILEIYLNHELITTKSSDSDYYVSDLIFVRDSYDENYIRNTMSVSGIFSTRNKDVSEFTKPDGTMSSGGQMYAQERRQYAEESERDGVKYYKYHLVVPINHGLARQDKPLPAGKHYFVFFELIFFQESRFN